MAKKAKVTLLNCLSLSVGGTRLVQNKTVVIEDPELIRQMKQQSGVSVVEFDDSPPEPAKAKEPEKSAGQPASSEAEAKAATAQAATRRKVRGVKQEAETEAAPAAPLEKAPDTPPEE